MSNFWGRKHTPLESARTKMMYYVGGPHAIENFSRDLDNFESAVRHHERDMEAQRMSGFFKAKFEGQCGSCGKKIEEGDWAAYSDEEKDVLLCQRCKQEENEVDGA